MILPELQLKPRGRIYISPFKLYGEKPKRPRLDKTCITERFIVCENGEDAIKLTTYLQRRDGKSWIEVVRYLASEANLTLPTNEDFDCEAYAKQMRKAEILEVCNDYFIWNLQNNDNAQDCRDYLTNVREYPLSMVRDMGMGFLPTWKSLEKYLLKRRFSQELIDSEIRPLFSLDKRMSTTHRLTIPYISGGKIKGFKLRTHLSDIQPKYINTVGLDRKSGFFNLPVITQDKEIIIVEGELDALHACAKGITNVVSLGCSSMNENQIFDAMNRGVKRFTLCLDNDEAGVKAIIKSIRLLRQCGVSEIYVAFIPEPYKDLDAFLKHERIEVVSQVIEEASCYYLYELKLLIEKYQTPLSDKKLAAFFAELLPLAKSLDNDIQRDILFAELKRATILPYKITRKGFMASL